MPTRKQLPRFKKPNYVQVPNMCFDEWMRELSGSEFKIMMLTIRKTVGWKDLNGGRKKEDAISVTQFVEYCGMARQTVIDAIKGCIDAGILKRTSQMADGTYYYALVVEEDEEDNQNLVTPLSNDDNLAVRKPYRQDDSSGKKSRPTKEISTLKKKDDKASSSKPSKKKQEQPQEPKKPYVMLSEYALQTIGLMFNANDCRLAKDDIEAFTLEAMLEAVDIAKAQGKGGINYKYIARIAKNKHDEKLATLEAKNKQRVKNEAMVLKINPVAPVAPVNDDELDNLFS